MVTKRNNEEETATWRIKKEISLGDLIAFVMAFMSVVYAYFTLDKRLAVLEDRAVRQEAVASKNDSERQRALEEIRLGLRLLNEKVDRMYGLPSIPRP